MLLRFQNSNVLEFKVELEKKEILPNVNTDSKYQLKHIQ